jgi:nicotinate-nucleotide pyrophosphorylase (carboxylating)
VRRALAEDVGTGDVTTLSIIHEQASARAVMVAREPLVVAGVELAEESFRQLAPAVKVDRVLDDGKKAGQGSVILRVAGPARALLTAERVALNFIQRFSGIATLTAQYVAAVKAASTTTPAGVPPAILDTRKTTPGLRRFEKYAVECGGGQNHRSGLFDRVLIKDNHLAALKGSKPNAVAAAIARARQRYPHLQVEVEADTLEQVRQAADAGADFILLDNMSNEQLREAVRMVSGRAKLEASGGVTLQTVRAIAETGVDFISVGALTHSAPAVDIGLDFER